MIVSIYKNWLETDLTRAAIEGRLGPAVGVDDALHELANLLDGGLNAVVVGEPGVGKSALIHQMVIRSVQGYGPKRLRRRRVLQISLRKQMALLQHHYEIHGEAQKLFKAVREQRRPAVLFIRDFGLVEAFGLENELTALTSCENVVVIGESEEAPVASMFEYETALRQQFGVVRVEEPGLEKAKRIVCGWSNCQKNAEFSEDAIEQAVALSHRFMARSRLPRKAIDLLKHASTDATAGTVITSTDIARQLSSQHRIPRVLVDPTVPLNLLDFKRSLGRSVIGQEEAISAVVDTIGVIKAGLTDLRRPLAALLFAGPTGVGKTLIAQTIATRLFGRRDRLIRFNMADYKSQDDAELLFGCAAAKEKELQRGQMTLRMAGHTLGVLLLDEFEKAHPLLHDRFLQLLDEGEFINGLGEKVSCRSFIIIVTTNAGDAHGTPTAFGYHSNADGRPGPMDELVRHFRFELLNRFDRVVRFRRLTKDDALSIVVAELRELQSRIGLRQHGLTLEVELAAADLLVSRGYDAERGARNLRRTIEQEVAVPIAQLLVQGAVPTASRIRVGVRDGSIHAALVSPQSAVVKPRPRLSRSKRLMRTTRPRPAERVVS